MCGIAGIQFFDGRAVEESELHSMLDLLHHRGPDDEGLVVEGSVGIGHRRLAIIDLSNSRQPMRTPDGRFTLTFNGEIFNYRALRSSADYPFTTHGDTEVVLATVARQGPEASASFVGQFAFAVHDHLTHETVLVRDRVGVLPLYYYLDDQMLVFASEIKALLAILPGERSNLDGDQLRSYLKARAVHGPHTLFRSIKKVMPGHVVRISATGQVTSTPFWCLPDPSDVLSVSADQAVDLVEESLTEAVRSALVADVPVGAYLSGGVDSSLIVALATAATRAAGSGERVKTFAAEFGDERFDETQYAELVSREFGTDHHRVQVSPGDFRQSWQQMSWYRDAPISEPADIAVAQLAHAARQHVKVVLSGEGSDELFGGYPKYRFAQATQLAGRLPSGIRLPLVRWSELLLPASRSKLRIALRALSGRGDVHLQDWFAPFTDGECDRLLGRPDVRPFHTVAHRDAVDLMGRLDLGTWLPDNLLERGDRMTMSASLELRPPFLDHRLVDLAFRLPSQFKVRHGQTKWVLKQVALRHLPREIVYRPKVGFRVPLDAWFRGELKELAHDLLLDSASFVATVMETAPIADLMDSHTSGRRDEEIRIWTLLSLEVWGRQITGVPV